MVNRILVAVALLGTFVPSISADDKTERDRKARVAWAIANAGKGEVKGIAIAPVPHEAKQKDYATGHNLATGERLPLVVFVGCEGYSVDGAVWARWDSYPGVKGPAVVIGYPVGDRVAQDAVLSSPVTPEDMKRAVKDATRKADAKPMPARSAPQPLDTFIHAGGDTCTYCTDCKCKEGDCPSRCAVTATSVSTPVPVPVVYYTFPAQPVCVNGRCYVQK